MSFSGSDDTPVCDVCNTWFVYDAIVPWPLPGADRRPARDLFVICQECVQNLILEASSRPGPQAGPRVCLPLAGEPGAAPRRRDGHTGRVQAHRGPVPERAWNARHDAEAARRRQQEDEMAAQFRRELDGLDEITGRR